MRALAPVGTPVRGSDRQVTDSLATYQRRVAARLDRAMALLLAAEWLGAVILAFAISPVTWDGDRSRLHPHVIAAVLIGPLLVALPALLAVRYPSRAVTRQAIAVCQMLMSSLLIEVTNGRIETHFHIFGSLAFLAFYRDPAVLLTASAVTGLDHLVRGWLWPLTIYGDVTASPWRWIEHAWWVAFEDFFLLVSFRHIRREMTVVARREARLDYGAHHDMLTGLPNRRMLNDRFIVSRLRPASLAVFFLDLDRFKQVNDTLGHAVGDRLLSTIAQRLDSLFNADDTVARIGGDEFLILAHFRTQEQIGEIAERILSAFCQTIDLAGARHLLSASVGVSIAPDHGDDLASLQSAADVAMYHAKSRGRGRWALYSPDMASRKAEKRDIERELHHALSRGQLETWFQPIMGRREEVKGFEALLRWRHPSLGMVPPSEFIPVAEETGLIVPFGEWVLEQACRACVLWQTNGASGVGVSVGVSVNVSAVQFELPDFAEMVQRILSRTGVAAHLLTLELTETSLIRNVNVAGRHLSTLREAGVHIALDDFGTGYSSLGYLEALPASSIKLDSAFIARATGNQPRMLRSLLELAHENGLEVTAEGVETPEQREMLRQLGCDRMQGYLYAKPMPAAEITAFLRPRLCNAVPEQAAEVLEPVRY